MQLKCCFSIGTILHTSALHKLLFVLHAHSRVLPHLLTQRCCFGWRPSHDGFLPSTKLCGCHEELIGTARRASTRVVKWRIQLSVHVFANFFMWDSLLFEVLFYICSSYFHLTDSITIFWFPPFTLLCELSWHIVKVLMLKYKSSFGELLASW